MKILSFDIGLKNLAYCICNFTDDNINIEEWNVKCLSTSKKPLPLDELNKIIINFFDSNPDFLKVDQVLIEQQPTKNPLMKNISIMIHTYFIIRGIIDKTINNCNINRVLFFSPKNKLKIYDGPEIICTLKSRYSQRKKIGIIQTRYFINKFNLTNYSELFEKSKKKDDLADSFLQALCYFKLKEFNKNQNPKDNFHKWKGISRKPSQKQLKDENYTIPNLRYYFGIALRNNDVPSNEEELKISFPENNIGILKSIKKNFGKDAVIANIIEKL
jgi:hypothetical protein